MSLASIDIDWGALLEAGYISVIAAMAISLIAAVGVASSLQATASADGSTHRLSGGYGIVTIACVIALVAIVAYGISLIAS